MRRSVQLVVLGLMLMQATGLTAVLHRRLAHERPCTTAGCAIRTEEEAESLRARETAIRAPAEECLVCHLLASLSMTAPAACSARAPSRLRQESVDERPREPHAAAFHPCPPTRGPPAA